MITKISASKKDKARLASLRVDPKALKNDFFQYAGLVIKKPWGYEYLVFENENVAIWVLYIQHGFQTSLHCHPNKKTSLTVLAGEALCTTLNGVFPVRPGEGLLIDKGTFHSTRAISPEGIIVMETETPNNKRDLVRLDDKYGRKDKGYEGKESHVNLEELDYLNLASFNEKEKRYNELKTIGECELFMVRHKDPKTFRELLGAHDAHLVGVTKGTLHNGGKSFLGHGDIATFGDLKQNENVHIMDEIELLFIKHKEPISKTPSNKKK